MTAARRASLAARSRRCASSRCALRRPRAVSAAQLAKQPARRLASAAWARSGGRDAPARGLRRVRVAAALSLAVRGIFVRRVAHAASCGAGHDRQRLLAAAVARQALVPADGASEARARPAAPVLHEHRALAGGARAHEVQRRRQALHFLRPGNRRSEGKHNSISQLQTVPLRNERARALLSTCDLCTTYPRSCVCSARERVSATRQVRRVLRNTTTRKRAFISRSSSAVYSGTAPELRQPSASATPCVSAHRDDAQQARDVRACSGHTPRQVHAVLGPRLLHGEVELIGIAQRSLVAQHLRRARGSAAACGARRLQVCRALMASSLRWKSLARSL